MFKIASTISFDIGPLSSEINFDCMLVLQILRSDSLSSGCIFIDISERISRVFADASRYPSTITEE